MVRVFKEHFIRKDNLFQYQKDNPNYDIRILSFYSDNTLKIKVSKKDSGVELTYEEERQEYMKFFWGNSYIDLEKVLEGGSLGLITSDEIFEHESEVLDYCPVYNSFEKELSSDWVYFEIEMEHLRQNPHLLKTEEELYKIFHGESHSVINKVYNYLREEHSEFFEQKSYLEEQERIKEMERENMKGILGQLMGLKPESISDEAIKSFQESSFSPSIEDMMEVDELAEYRVHKKTKKMSPLEKISYFWNRVHPNITLIELSKLGLCRFANFPDNFDLDDKKEYAGHIITINYRNYTEQGQIANYVREHLERNMMSEQMARLLLEKESNLFDLPDLEEYDHVLKYCLDIQAEIDYCDEQGYEIRMESLAELVDKMRPNTFKALFETFPGFKLRGYEDLV
ncbi:hypothetical protein KY321_05385 [Candidatus Woesearchaeota archaeon]|nr:hypothetical protein [Candidatus Woesearchaeota archaeon]